MTDLRFLLLFLLLLWNANQTATPSNQIAESKYVNSFSAVDSTGRLIELEHQNVTTFHSKMKPTMSEAERRRLAEVLGSLTGLQGGPTGSLLDGTHYEYDPNLKVTVEVIRPASATL